MKMQTAAFAATLVLAATAAHAELVVSGNDGHQPDFAQQKLTDNVAVIDFTNGRARTLGTVAAPASIIGPPTSVAVAPNERMALVTGGTKADPADPTKTALDDVLSVIDLTDPAHPKVAQTLHSGQGAGGVAINRAGSLALVANTNEDSISIYSIANGRLTAAGKLQLPAGARPQSVSFLPDGASALALAAGDTGMLRLSVSGTTVAVVGPVGNNLRATLAKVTPDGRFAVMNGGPALAGGRGGRGAGGGAAAAGAAPAGAAAGGAAAGGRGAGGPPRVAQASLVDLSNGAVVATADLGAGPEAIALSPDGTWLAATITNGSHSAATSPGFNDFGLLKVYRVSANAITPVAEAHTGHWCQGAVWSRDNRTVLLQCAIEKEIEVFRLEGSTLTRDQAATIKLDAGGAGMAAASNP